jgi:hypothetical protein
MRKYYNYKWVFNVQITTIVIRMMKIVVKYFYNVKFNLKVKYTQKVLIIKSILVRDHQTFN